MFSLSAKRYRMEKKRIILVFFFLFLILYATKKCPRCYREYLDSYEFCTKDQTKLIKIGIVTVPSVIDSSETIAKKIIKNANLIPKVKTELTEDMKKIGKVLKQQPNAGEKAQKGSTITIWIAYPQPKYPQIKETTWFSYIDLNLFPPQPGKSLAGIVIGDSFNKVRRIFGIEDRLERSWFHYIKDNNVLKFHYNEDKVDTISLELSDSFEIKYYQMLKNIHKNYSSPAYKDSSRKIYPKYGVTFFLSADTIVAIQIYAPQKSIWQIIGAFFKKYIAKFKPCFP